MTKRDFWKKADKAAKARIADSVDSNLAYMRQVFMYDRHTSAKKARILSAETGGVIGAHEFCPDAFTESDSLSINSQESDAA